MKPEKNDTTIISLLQEAEEKISEYADELLECEFENDQLFADCRALDNILNQISNRVAMVKSGYSSPDIVVDEIGLILQSVDK